MKKIKASSLLFCLFLGIVLFYILNRAVELLLLNRFENFSISLLVELIRKNPFYVDIQNYSLAAGLIGFIAVFFVYLYSLGERNNYRWGEEHGSAKWGNEKDIKSFVDKNHKKNILLTKKECLSLNTRKTFRNNNVLVIGGAGSGKTRYYVKPNLMQLQGSYVITDPKGALLTETGQMFRNNGYEIRVFDLVNMQNSDRYNFFDYIHTEKDILKLIKNLITNTNGTNNNNSGDFWEKAEIALLQSLFAFVVFEAAPEDRNINSVMELLQMATVSEEDENYKSQLDVLMEILAEEKPNHFACRQYDIYKKAAGKTAKSILISVGVRLAPFNIDEISNLLSEDELYLDTIGDRPTAFYVILPDTDSTFNFIAAMMYQQMFDELVRKADASDGKRLNLHVRCMLDEFANIGKIPEFEILISTIRSREISVNIILQTLSQLKKLYKDDAWEIIVGNCDSILFLGGKEQSTLKYMSEMLGKTTVDMKTVSENKGQNGSYTIGNQVVGRELMTPAEIGLLPSDTCILSIRGIRPFLSKKYPIEKHENYSLLSDYSKKNIYKHKKELFDEDFTIFVKDVFCVEEINLL